MDVAAENVHLLYDTAPRAPLDKTVNPRISSRIVFYFLHGGLFNGGILGGVKIFS